MTRQTLLVLNAANQFANCTWNLMLLIIDNLNSYQHEGLGEGRATLIAWWGAEQVDVDGRVSPVIAYNCA